MSEFIDDKIEHIEEDIRKIQVKPNMYISYLGSKGALHLLKETINNCTDEAINTNSPADTIDIFLDETINTATVSDNGRGIPEDMMEIVCTTLQSGSKFTRSGTGMSSAGENGVGMTATNALCSKYQIISYRNDYKYDLGFVDGEKEYELKSSKLKNPKHGTTIIMQPSRKYLGEDCDIITDDLMAWLDKLVYLMPKHLKTNLSVKKKGKESIISKKYVNKNGLYDYVDKLCPKGSVDPVHFMKSMKLMEKDRDEEIERFIGLEVAFTYDPNSVEFICDSFVNMINTIDNGTHADAVKQAICQFFVKKTKESMTERESKKLDIIFNDVTQGLVLTVYLATNMNCQFTGQTKEKAASPELFKPVRDMTYKALNEYFTNNSKDLKKIIDRIKVNCKARIESTKVRNSVIKGETNNFEQYLLKGYTPCNNTGKNDYRELLIVEGQSSAGSVSQGRFDNDTQAILGLKGVPLNGFGMNLDRVLQNAEMNTLVRVLGTNIGPKFDISKLYFDKIIIMSDSDSDGYNIASLICAFFMYHMPEIIKQGHLYKAVAPLYKLKNKEHPFVHDKKGFIDVFEDNIRKYVTIGPKGSSKPFSDKELAEFLFNNRDYLEDLERASSQLAIHPTILEFILIHRNDKDFEKKLTKVFPELKIEDNVLTGIFNGKYQILIMDKLFEKRIKRLNKYVEANNGHMYYHVNERTSDKIIDKGVMSVGQFLKLCQKYQPVIKTRFKGLGELNADELRDTTLDPNNRILIRMTMDDVERELEIFNTLHGNDDAGRKLMMKHLSVSREDLDN